jgi:LmbE family N-acetylglucosaminyl deacetylase
MSELTDFACGLPEIERAMVLAPHPDDESLGCGGTIALYSGKVSFTVVAVSRGEALSIPEDNIGDLRIKEFEDAAAVLGAREFICLEIPDGKFAENRDSIRSKFSGLFADRQPQVVFLPSPVDLHPDHVETALACLEVSREFPSLKLAFYEVYTPIRFNILVDIGPVIETKRRALMGYHFSMLKKEDTFAASNLGLNKSRSLFTLRDSYYEAFWIPPGPLTLTDVVRWFSNELWLPSPEDRLLDNLRAADALIAEMRLIEDRVSENEKVAGKLTMDLRLKEQTIAALRDHIHLLESGFFQKLAVKYYNVRNSLFPEGTSRKLLYNKVVGVLKDRARQKKD